MASYTLFLKLLFTMTVVYGQIYENFNYNSREKPGSCSPPLSVDICTKSCYWDSQCLGIQKCCPTSCGGSVCTRPVTSKNPEKIGVIKPGSCPNPSSGRWICSSTCIDDSDCPETRKCCKTRCGGLICKKPQQMTDEVFVPNNEVDINSNSIPFDNNNNNNNNFEPFNNNNNNNNFEPFNNNNNNNFVPAYHANRDNPFLFG